MLLCDLGLCCDVHEILRHNVDGCSIRGNLKGRLAGYGIIGMNSENDFTATMLSHRMNSAQSPARFGLH